MQHVLQPSVVRDDVLHHKVCGPWTDVGVQCTLYMGTVVNMLYIQTLCRCHAPLVCMTVIVDVWNAAPLWAFVLVVAVGLNVVLRLLQSSIYSCVHYCWPPVIRIPTDDSVAAVSDGRVGVVQIDFENMSVSTRYYLNISSRYYLNIRLCEHAHV